MVINLESVQTLAKKSGRQRKKSGPRTAQPGLVRLAQLTIRNYKGIADLQVEFPAPRMAADPDVFVIGSPNGGGKTSVLEACALLFWPLGPHLRQQLLFPELEMEAARYLRDTLPFDAFDLMLRAGEKEAEITGVMAHENEQCPVATRMTSSNGVRKKRESSPDWLQGVMFDDRLQGRDESGLTLGMWRSLLALDPEPLLLPGLLYFNSYRKVKEGSTELGAMVDPGSRLRGLRYRSASENRLSLFKIEILRSMMSKGGLFENIPDKEADAVLDQLNLLIERFADGRVDKLRPAADNTVEFRVSPKSGGPSFSFDGLSSGQKEIISTLFLIWHYTKDRPRIVLIDEPELHLNAEWHAAFVHTVCELAPQNQYLLATHSAAVFGAVPADRRLLLKLESR